MQHGTDRLASVTTTLTYLVKCAEKPYVHTEALTGDSEPHYFAEQEEREVTIHDGRPLADRLSLDRQGFELHARDTAVDDLYDDAAVESAYYAEVETLIRELTGASRVVIFDHTRRSDAEQRTIRGPASRVHNDYTERSGPERIREVLGEDRAAELGDVSVAQINLWRPISGPVKRSPLALLDASSLDLDDLMATDLVYPDRTGEIYHLAYNPNQRWYCFPDMRRDEFLLIKGYDSRCDGRVRFTPHTAFRDPRTPPDAPPRESIEVRTLAFF
ncbi:CmcJ/NvfI family oxidoreductase [Halomonas ramblicola]|uniref:CmcJ/NvfI family oxidoreductase n=1 Tax=Halomonas ramblicola TaxID=747349 RepID=UPI0025B446B6|nr:CmcJ/NvfI family oxidoreductase [Halomonas ramblicola]MDN3520162.1 CmcJ/NvfI family oxidoreductase [Halomonas ramblicola]